jgi:ABC-type branched-subunit amino acid transport system permease subunit
MGGQFLTLTFVYITASVSLRTITVFGQFPLAHAAFMGIGAYISGMAIKMARLVTLVYHTTGGFDDDVHWHPDFLPLCQAENALLCHGIFVL